MNNFYFTFEGKQVEGSYFFEAIADYNVISVFIHDDQVAKIAGSHFHILKHINPESYYQFALEPTDRERALKLSILDMLRTFNL